VREQMKDADPQIRIQAIRASETLFKAGDRSFAADYKAAARDGDADVAIQGMLTSKLFNLPDLKEIVEGAQAANKARGVQVIGAQILNPAMANAGRGGGGGRGGPPPFTTEEGAVIAKGETVYKELCFTCHGPDGRGAPQDGGPAGTIMAPSLVGSPRVLGHTDYVIKTLLHGLNGPLEGRTYPAGVMMPMGQNNDEWIANIASYIRNSFGNRGAFVTAADVARVRASTASRKTLWTPEELEASVPRVLTAQPSWKVTASHNEAAAGGGLTFTTWNTNAPQQPGMWFQVELPEATRLTEIQFESPAGRGAGGRGRANAPAGAPGAPNQPVAEAPAPVVEQPPATYPRGHKVEVSVVGQSWTTVAEGPGPAARPAGQTTVIRFEPVRAKFVKITQTATAEPPVNWAIQRLRLYEVGGQ
jgi:mono/diheme cytochrome c family protein